MSDLKIPVITIEGPTAVGKSKLALEFAKYMDTSIISADSRQVYKLLNIGTAKPSKKELDEVKHYLIDCVYPDQEYNAGRFAKDSVKICSQLYQQNKIPIICGGTGFYINALLKGLAFVPTIPDDIKNSVKIELEEVGNKKFYEQLKVLDPIAAEKINYQDGHRMLRAMEVFRHTGKPLSFFWKQQEHEDRILPFRIMITEDREVLYNRIEKRVDMMIDNGLINEINSLLEKGYKENDPGMITVGYREFYPFLRNEISLNEAINLVKQHTRNYAKRQFTWYRKQVFDLTISASYINFLEIIRKVKSLNKNIKGFVW